MKDLKRWEKVPRCDTPDVCVYQCRYQQVTRPYLIRLGAKPEEREQGTSYKLLPVLQSDFHFVSSPKQGGNPFRFLDLRLAGFAMLAYLTLLSQIF